MSLERTIYDIFYDNAVAYAEAELDASGGVSYKTKKEVPDLADVIDHLDGVRTLGAYTLQGGDMVRWAAFDVDSKLGLDEAKKLASKLALWLASKNIPFHVEFSGSKGYHIYLFFIDKESGKLVKKMMDRVRDIVGAPKSGDVHVEVFPKQGETTKTNPFGNLLRLPLGIHYGTKNKCFFVNTTEWETGAPLDPEKVFDEKTTLAALTEAVESEGDQAVEKEIISLMIPYWSPGQRHNVALAFSGALAICGWVKEEVVKIVTEIHDTGGSGSLADQLKAVDSTYVKYHAGESVLGLNGLAVFMTTADLNKLAALAGRGAASNALLEIDNIRLGKGAVFLKIRSAAGNVIQHLMEDGRIVRDENDTHWIGNADHDLFTFDTPTWIRFLHNHYGLNQAESFGKQVMEAIRHLAYDRARLVNVKKRSHWDGTYEYMNLGGKEIYILEGDPAIRRVVYNGEIDNILFKNAEDSFHLENLYNLSVPALSPWPYLTDDVNFADGDGGLSAVQQAQLLKAFFMCTFFAEIMPVRPLLTIVADPGLGKTTTARRLLKIQEGWSAEVTSPSDDKPDALRAILTHHRYLVLDNLEKTDMASLPDMLNRVATGLQIELRQLHTTNNLIKFKTNCWVTMTATKLPFADETVYSRILPIFLGPMVSRKLEEVMQADLINNFEGIWKGLLDDIDVTIASLKANTVVTPPNDIRLADFAVFCERIKDAPYLNGKELMNGLGSLVNQQKETLEKSSAFVEALAALLRTLPAGKTEYWSMNELYARTKKFADMLKLEWRWSSVQALAMHVKVLEPQLVKNFGMEIRKNRENGREVNQYRFTVDKLVVAPSTPAVITANGTGHSEGEPEVEKNDAAIHSSED